MTTKIFFLVGICLGSSLSASYPGLHGQGIDELAQLEKEEAAEKEAVRQAALEERSKIVADILKTSKCSLNKSVTVQIILTTLPTLNRHYIDLDQLLEESVGLARTLLPLGFLARYGAESGIFEFRASKVLAPADEAKIRAHFDALASKK